MEEREIKFRAWDEELKKMVEQEDLGMWNRTPGQLLDRYSIVLQYTGLKDKNGKEICEGDLLDVDNGDRIVEVVWFKPQACFNSQFVKVLNTKSSYFRGLLPGEWMYRCKVIGNVWENSELMAK